MESAAAPEGGISRVSTFLRAHREQILSEWSRRVRALPAARDLSTEALLDHLPHLLDRIALMVADGEDGRAARGTGSDPDIHAIQRMDEGYELDAVVQEYALLRECLLDLWTQQSRQVNGITLLNRAIDEAIIIAVGKGTRARERTLVALDRISAATIESHDPEVLLRALTRVLLETTSSVDSVSIYLRQGTTLHLRAAVGLEEDRTNRFSVEVGSDTCAGLIAETGQPFELRDAASHRLASDALRGSGAHAFYGVPMMRQGRMIGVAHISSRTAFEFSSEDKLVFRSMVERATEGLEQARLHVELEEERRRLFTVIESLPVAVWVSDAEGKVQLANRAANELWGSPVPMSGSVKDYSEYQAWYPDGRPVATDEWGISQAIQHGETVKDCELVIRRFDGGRRVVLMSGTPIRGERGEIIGGVAINVDITERKRAEAALRKSESRLRRIAETGLVGMFIWHQDHRVLEANDEFLRMVGYTREELEAGAIDWWELRAPDLRDPTARLMEQLRETGSIRFEKQILRRDGSRVDTIVFGALLPDEGDFGVALVLDISASKETERRLAESEVRHRTILSALQEGVLLLDAENTVSVANESAARILSVPFDQLLGSNVTDPPWERLRPDGSPLPCEERAVWRAFRSGQTVRNSRSGIRHPDGRLTWVEADAQPLRHTEDGRITGVVVAFRDVTEQRQHEQERQERQQFEQQLIGIVSHDLRNPISAIKMTIHQLLKQDDLDERVLKAAARILGSADRATKLIRDLLDFTRVRMGSGLVLQQTPASLHELSEQVIEEIRAAHPNRDIQFERQGDAWGAFDIDRLQQVVQNLVANAIKYSLPDSPVQVRSTGAGKEVVLEVSNAGAPIAPSQIPRLFEPLQRGSGQTDSGSRSIGLGLYIVDAIVRGHGGTIDVRSTEEAGTTFTVRLPRGP